MLRNGLGVSIMPVTSVNLDAIDHRPVTDFTDHRQLELVMTSNATVSPALATPHEATMAFDWTQNLSA